jgi:hypothetical protein
MKIKQQHTIKPGLDSFLVFAPPLELKTHGSNLDKELLSSS